ncbi:MAG: hypothetical protein K5697_09795 [Lachnospiraceae bacterium]|nr:hypothetical protein [Lachnospiraceae bacterium]
MMKRSYIASTAAVFALSAMLLTGCGDDEAQRVLAGAATEPAEVQAGGQQPAAEEKSSDNTAYEKGSVIRISCATDGQQGRMRFTEDMQIDGRSYHRGDLKPEWAALQDRLDIVIEDHYGGETDKECFQRWQEKLDSIDMLSVSGLQMKEAGEAGELADLSEYLDRMPHFAAFLEENPVVRMSISLSTDEDHAGAVYAVPYPSDPKKIEKLPYIRADWVKILLDGKDEFAPQMSGRTALPVYQPFMPLEGKLSVEVVKADGSGTETISKNYDAAGNIIAKMNAAGAMSGTDAVNMFRSYIDEAYNGYYGTKRSDLFLGRNAAWDADELVALLRCTLANTATLSPEGNVTGLFAPREDSNASRAGLYQLAGMLFGVRGLNSDDYLYIDRNGVLHDARCEQGSYDVLLKMNEMYREGLISSFYVNGGQNMLNNAEPVTYQGLMTYAGRDLQLIDVEGEADEGCIPVMIPLSLWDDGSGSSCMRFTENVGKILPGGWAISAKAVKDDENRLNACLALIDQLYADAAREEQEEETIDLALRLETVRQTVPAIEGDLWYTTPPSAFAVTNTEDEALLGLNTLEEGFSQERVGNGENILINVMLRADTGTPGGEAAAAEYFGGRGGSRRLGILQAAWDGMRK